MTTKKEKRLNLIKMLGFSLLLILVLSLVYKVLSWKDTSGGYQSVTSQLYNTDKNLIDAVALGSSHTYAGIYPLFIWEDYGISFFDMSVSGQDKNSTYYDLKELLKTQSPKVVFVDLYGAMFDKHAVQGNVYRNMLALKTSKNSIDLVNAYIEKGQRSDYILRWPIIHTRYKELERYDFEDYEYSLYGRGEFFGFATEVCTYPVGALNEEVTPINDLNKEWIDKLTDLSLSEGFDLYFTVIPFSITEEERAKMNGVIEYAESLGYKTFDFIDMAYDLNISWEEDFSDGLHLNNKGAEKISRYLGEWLSENYDLTDHRGDSDYYQWDEDLYYYKALLRERALPSLNLDQILNHVYSSKDLVALVSLDNDFGDRGQYLETFGITEDEYLNGGKWVISSKEIVCLSDNTQTFRRYYSINSHENVKCAPEAEIINYRLNLNDEPIVHVENGMSVTIYDSTLDKVILRAGY